MPAVYRNGQWVIDGMEEEEQQAMPAMPPLNLRGAERDLWVRDQELQRQFQEDEARARKLKGSDTRPFWAQSPGQFLGDAAKMVANAGVGIVTDYMDLAAGLADVAVQTGSAITGNGFDGNKVFEDSDNPWTQWRRETFRTESQAGHLASNLLRVGTAIVSFPKVTASLVKFAPKLATGAKLSGGLGNIITKLDDVAKARQATTTALNTVGKGMQAKSAGARATQIAAGADWLGLTYADVARSIDKGDEFKGVADWMKNVQQSSKALTQLTKGSGTARVRTLGEALAWDAFVAFNVFGEGDDEFDETLLDMAGDLNMPLLQTDVEDSGLQRKAKQMLEGLAVGTVMNGVLDMARVHRFAKNYRNAAPDQRRMIVEAFNVNADEIGRGLGRTLVAEGRVQGVRTPSGLTGLQEELFRAQQVEQAKIDFRARQLQQQAAGQIVPAGQVPQVFQAPGVPEVPGQGLNVEQLLANQQLAGAQDALPGVPPPAGLLPQGASPALLPGGPQAQPPGAPPAGLLGAGGPPVPVTPGMEPVQVLDITPREPTPVVTPDTIRSAFERDAYQAFRASQELTFEEGPDGVMRSLASQVEQLMPRTRVDALEYLQKFRPQTNEYGVVQAADSIWLNFIYDRGLREGWASIDPDMFSVRFNRKVAADLDRGQAVMRQAEALDEANNLELFKQQFADRVADIERQKDEVIGGLQGEGQALRDAGPDMVAASEDAQYQAWLKNREAMNPGQMDAGVQENLAQREAVDAYDAWEQQQAGERLLRDEAMQAGREVDAIDAFEEVRLTEAELRAASTEMGDDEVVRVMLGRNLDEIEPATIERAQTGRGWEVYDRNGELLGTARTQRAAQQIAERQARLDRDALLARARQMEADAADESINVVIGNPVYDSDVVGKITLTDPQINAVQGILPRLDELLGEAWLNRRGPNAWFNVNELGKQQRTFELTQGDMARLQDGIRQVMTEAGDLKNSPKLRALRNLADKLDTQMKLLEPEARAQRFVSNLLDDTSKYIDHGEFCDFL